MQILSHLGQIYLQMPSSFFQWKSLVERVDIGNIEFWSVALGCPRLMLGVKLGTNTSKVLPMCHGNYSRLAPHTNIRVSSSSVHLLRSLSNTLEKQYSICEQMSYTLGLSYNFITEYIIVRRAGRHCPSNVKVIVNKIPYFQTPQGSSLGPPGSQFPVEHYQDP